MQRLPVTRSHDVEQKLLVHNPLLNQVGIPMALSNVHDGGAS
jgi:hypothetical protein